MQRKLLIFSFNGEEGVHSVPGNLTESEDTLTDWNAELSHFFIRKHILEINCTCGTFPLTELHYCISNLQICSSFLHTSNGFPLPGGSSSDSMGRLTKPGRVCLAYFSNLTSHNSPQPRLHTLGTQLAVSCLAAFPPPRNALSSFTHLVEN